MDEHSLSADADAEEFHRHESVLVDELRHAYASVGIVVEAQGDFRLRGLAAMNWSPNDEAMFQDGGNDKLGRPSTRAPVERVQRAIDALWDAMAECHRIQDQRVGDRINVARTFVDLFAADVDNHAAFESFYSYAHHLAFAAQEALRTGREPRPKPPNLLYDEFIARVFAVAAPAPAKLPAGKQIDLLLGCEIVLPKALRAPSRDGAKDRLVAFRERLPDGQANEVFDPSVHYGLSRESAAVVHMAGKLRR